MSFCSIRFWRSSSSSDEDESLSILPPRPNKDANADSLDSRSTRIELNLNESKESESVWFWFSLFKVYSNVCVRVLSGRKRSLFVAVGEERGKERNMICDDDMYCVGGWKWSGSVYRPVTAHFRHPNLWLLPRPDYHLLTPFKKKKNLINY